MVLVASPGVNNLFDKSMMLKCLEEFYGVKNKTFQMGVVRRTNQTIVFEINNKGRFQTGTQMN